MKNEMKMEYSAPCINEIMIELEHGIAAGSATAVSPNANNDVQEEWTIEEDVDRVIPW